MDEDYHTEQNIIKIRMIQRALLPLHVPETGEVHMFSIYRPMEAVGGDFYDIFSITETSVGICLADASGHGQTAALVASMCKFLIHSMKHRKPQPKDLLRQLNKSLQETLIREEFLTITYLLLNKPEYCLKFSCAGQFPILMVRSGEAYKLGTHSIHPPLGLFPDFNFHQDSYIMVPGDKLLMMTDGILEAKNNKGKMFCDTDFMNVIRLLGHLDGKIFLEKLFDRFLEFVGSTGQTDDWTIVVLERESSRKR